MTKIENTTELRNNAYTVRRSDLVYLATGMCSSYYPPKSRLFVNPPVQ